MAQAAAAEGSIFPWPEHWWTNTGRTDGTDLVVPAGAIFVPWASEARPVGEKKWTIEFRYDTASPVTVSIKHNPFSEPDENKQVSQYDLGQVTLPAGTGLVQKVEITLTQSDQPYWTPQFSTPAGSAEVRFHGILVYKTPDAPSPEPSGVTVRDVGVSVGTGKAMPSITATSQAGDWAVLAFASQWGNTAARAPQGWTELYSATAADGRSGYIAVKRISAPSETQGLTMQHDGGSAARERVQLWVLSGVKELTPHAWQGDVPDVTGQALLLSAQHGSKASYLIDWAKDMPTRRVAGETSTSVSWSVLMGALVDAKPDLRAPLPQAWAWVDITPDEATTPPASDPTVEVHGQGRVSVHVYDGASEVAAAMRPMPDGYKDIPTMLATRGFLVAHRGGSASWPEMSMKAYTQAVAHGAGALEVSTHRTSDGVWVLVHDQNLQGVDTSAPATPISQMTWEQVQQYRTKGERILRIEEYLAAYGSSHITVLDPKYSAASWSELALLLPTTAKDRVIWKSAGDATWLAGQWHAAGWKCWGYAYEQHATDGSLAKWAPSWDYLGFPYEAGEASWKVATGLGKPVWAHICPDKAAYETGLSKGAVGCMVSGVADVLPVSLV